MLKCDQNELGKYIINHDLSSKADTCVDGGFWRFERRNQIGGRATIYVQVEQSPLINLLPQSILNNSVGFIILLEMTEYFEK